MQVVFQEVYRAKARDPPPMKDCTPTSSPSSKHYFRCPAEVSSTFSLRAAVPPSGSLLLLALSARLECSGHSHQIHESLGLPCPGPLAFPGDSHSSRALLLPKRTQSPTVIGRTCLQPGRLYRRKGREGREVRLIQALSPGMHGTGA